MNNLVNRIGAILYALIVGFFGVTHFLNGSKMAGMIPAYLPSPIVWIYITGAAFILAAVAIIIDRQSRLAGYLLFLLLAIIIGSIHVPSLLHATSEAGKMMATTGILKDAAMAAAALLIAARGK